MKYADVCCITESSTMFSAALMSGQEVSVCSADMVCTLCEPIRESFHSFWASVNCTDKLYQPVKSLAIKLPSPPSDSGVKGRNNIAMCGFLVFGSKCCGTIIYKCSIFEKRLAMANLFLMKEITILEIVLRHDFKA